MTQMNISNDTLLAFFKKNNYKAELQPQSHQIFVTVKIFNKDFPLFARILDGGELLQLLIFIPCELKKELIPDVSRLLHMLNKELDVPGFCLDEQASALFYRIVLPTPHHEINEALLKAFIQTIERICTMFAQPIASVALGLTKLEDIVNKAKELHSKK